MDFQSFENKEVEEIKSIINKMKLEDVEFQEMEPRTEIGLFLFEKSAVKDKIKGCAS